MKTQKFSFLRRVLGAIGFILCTTVSNSAHAQDGSLYAALGGKAVMDRVIASAIQLWQVNPTLSDSFKNANVERLREQLGDQFCALAGGAGCTYEGGDMKTIHAKMKITTAQFNALAEDLQRAMNQHGVPNLAQNQLIAKLAPMRRDIVTH